MAAATISHNNDAGAEVWTERSRMMLSDLVRELREKARKSGDLRGVSVVETHISWVLLAGSEAFKIKKPVSLPFLDFSTFEARERACRTETRINRRLAPRVYQGIVPVRRRADGHFTLGAAGGSIVDWAVRMVRLDEALRADVLLSRGALTAPHIDAMASVLARFHADTTANEPWIARFGAPALIEQHVVENFVSLRAANAAMADGEAFVSEEDLGNLERWQIAFIRGRHELLEQRAAHGFIREGHGDLRLEHIFFRPSSTTPHAHEHELEVIDGIEFDDRYRFGDVCSDVAFLAMDLARLGHVDLAERFLAAYARETNDFDLLSLVDFYGSYRACVRATISATFAVQGSDAHLHAAAEARRYLLLAQSSRQRLSPAGPSAFCMATQDLRRPSAR